jgi:predicted dehydrogenase
MERREFLAGALALGMPRRPAERLRAVQFGTVHGHADGKLETLRRLGDYEVVGVVEPDAALRERAASRPAYRGVPWLTEAEALGRADVQVVAIETALEELVPLARRCVAAGKHVHLDKPAGPSLPAFRALLEEAEVKARLVQVGYVFRYNPAFAFLRRAVAEGWLGTLIEIHGVIGKKSPPAARRSNNPEPGGTMYELGCHLIDVVIALAGRPGKVTAHVKRVGEDGLADNQLAVFDYPKLSATIRSQTTDPAGGRRRQFSLVGTEGSIEIRPLEPPALSLFLEKPRGDFMAGSQAVRLPPTGGRYDGELIDLARAVRGEGALPYGAAHDLEVHEAVLRAAGMPTD